MITQIIKNPTPLIFLLISTLQVVQEQLQQSLQLTIEALAEHEECGGKK